MRNSPVYIFAAILLWGIVGFSAAQIVLHSPLTVADSLILSQQKDSMSYFIKTDSNCSRCQLLLKLFSRVDVAQKHPDMVSNVFQRTINCYRRNYNVAKTLPVINELNTVAEESNSTVLKAWVLNLRATAMIESNQYDSVLPMLSRAYELFKKTNTADGLALTSEHLAGVYWTIKDSAKCIYYNKKSLEYAEHNEWLKFIMLTNISVYYTRVRQYDSARYYLMESIQTGKGLGVSYTTLLRIDYSAGASEKTLEDDFNNGLKWSSKGNDFNGVRYAYITYARILVDRHQYARAEKLLKDCEKYLINCDDCLEYRADAYQVYAHLYDSLHNVPLAFKYLKLFNTANKELDDATAQKNIKMAEANIEFGKKEEQMKMEQEQAKAVADEKLKSQRNQKNAFMGGAVLLLIISVLIYRNLRNQKKAAGEIALQKKQVEIEHRKSENLLLNILPAKVAEELKISGTSRAQHFDEVTVLFTDFKGFTTISERLAPQQLVDELHLCFSAFDGIMAKYNIEKIKTVGDAYLAVAGLPVATANHATDVINAAIEIRELIKHRKAEKGEDTFDVRIGVHSGSVVAGIVGVKKFAYDIWGDTVNTAARMEQNSEAGKVNISEATYELVKGQFTCEYRGEIEAKNKGKMKMYFVES